MTTAKLIAVTQPLPDTGIPDAEALVAYCARVSAPQNQGNHDTTPREGLVFLLAAYEGKPHWVGYPGILRKAIDALDRAETDKAAAVEAMRDACAAVVGPMASSNSPYAANAGQAAYNAIRALSPPPAARGQDVEKLVEAALHARIPGGSEAWVWIMPQTDAFAPSEHQRDIARCMVKAALALFTGGGK